MPQLHFPFNMCRRHLVLLRRGRERPVVQRPVDEGPVATGAHEAGGALHAAALGGGQRVAERGAGLLGRRAALGWRRTQRAVANRA